MATNFRNDYPSSTNDESDGVAQDTIDQEEEEDKPANKNVAYVLKRLQSSGALIKKPKQDISAPSRNDCPSSTNDESDEVAQDIIDQEEEEDQPASKNVAYVLKKLQSSGALIKKPKQEHRCYTCDEDFPNWEELENHLIQHVSLPTIYLVKLPSDNEDSDLSGDENWSDEDEAMPSPNISAKSTPQKIDISQIMKKTGISITKPAEKKTNDPDSALSKLSGLGFTIKKGSTPIKQERSDTDQKTDDVIQKLGQLGGIKLKLKSDGNNMNTFKVINGLKDFKTSDDEEDGSGNDDGAEDHDDAFDDEQDKSGEHEGSGDEHDFGDDENVNRKVSVSDNSGTNKISLVNRKIIGLPKNIQTIIPKTEPVASPTKPQPPKPSATQVQPVRTGRPTIKQTPKRGANLPVSSSKETPQQVVEMSPQNVPTVSTSNNRESNVVNIENVVVKQEADTGDGSQSSNVPLFSGQIKSERTTPPLNDSTSTPVIATIKSEPESTSTTSQEYHSNQNTTVSTSSASFLPVTKTEDNIMTVIEINGDSNDEDDDCCVVSATPAPDVKPIVPKTENLPSSYPPPISYSTQPSYSSSAALSSCQMSSAPSTLKQHNFNWNAPDSKPAIDMLEKSADDIFDSLLSSATKKENNMSSDVSEYISLDTLGPQHSCDICNTRFTDVMLLEEHIRTTGHSKSIIAPSSSNLLPYNPQSGNILSTLLPVKQLAEQVGKLSGMGGSGPGFTHQQNVMINIQAYPGSGGVMGPPPPYNAYASGQNMHSGFGQTVPNNMYIDPGQMPGQYPGQNFMGQSGYGQQFQSPMSKAGYSGPMPQGVYSTPSATPAFSSASPLQGMQQAAYGQNSAGLMNTQMGPPGSSPNHPYVPVSSPGGPMKPATGASGIKIQNVQTFPPGQLIGSPGQQLAQGQSATPVQGGPKSSPNQIRVASTANVVVGRPRMPSVRGARPSIRPGIMVHGQVRGAKPMAPRMPLKRPGTMTGGPNQKRRPDMLLPGKHDNEDCQVMAMQKQRDGLPMIQSVQGAKDKLNIGSQISITKKTVNKEANAMANVLASRGISVVQKQKSRSPTPERPVPHIPNLGAGVSIKHTSKSSNFSIPEAKVGGGMLSCKICKKMFMNQNSLSVHMSNAHPQSKMSAFKCDECPASYPTSLQLQHHKRVFHNVTGPNRELGLPVVDLSHEDNLKRLSNLGIYSFIPLANREQAGGCFGIPVISVHNAQNGYTNNLQALGADGLLTLGPLKPLPKS